MLVRIVGESDFSVITYMDAISKHSPQTSCVQLICEIGDWDGVNCDDAEEDLFTIWVWNKHLRSRSG